MCDALARNLRPELATLVAHCLSHGRREFVSLADPFPAECRHVLEALGQVYRVDAQAREQGLSAAQRLAHHQTHSQPVLEALHAWMRRQHDDQVVEPNTRLGEAHG